MGLIIKPNSKYRALQCHVYRWDSFKKVFRGEPITVQWSLIKEILAVSSQQNSQYYLHFETADGLQANLHFFTDEIENKADFESFLTNNPDKVRHNKFSYFGEQMVDSVGPYLRYGAVTTKYVIGLLALTFMFFQLKYFGSLLIEKYQFLIKASCNQQCAQELWSISTLWFYVLMATLSPLIPFLFYKKIYSAVAKSKNIQVINSAMIETFLLAGLGVVLLFSTSPKILSSTSKYTRVLVAYSDGSLQAKLSQKVEMASKRKFQGDVDDTEEIELLEDLREE